MRRILVNGTFDILHLGHVRLLQYARELGDHLLVCIDTDTRVRQLKGPQRPINDQDTRREMLMALRAVDAVEMFDSDSDLENLIQSYRPYVMVKGSDYQNRPIVGEEFCHHIIFYDRLQPFSTTNTIQDIADRR